MSRFGPATLFLPNCRLLNSELFVKTTLSTLHSPAVKLHTYRTENSQYYGPQNNVLLENVHICNSGIGWNAACRRLKEPQGCTTICLNWRKKRSKHPWTIYSKYFEQPLNYNLDGTYRRFSVYVRCWIWEPYSGTGFGFKQKHSLQNNLLLRILSVKSKRWGASRHSSCREVVQGGLSS